MQKASPPSNVSTAKSGRVRRQDRLITDRGLNRVDSRVIWLGSPLRTCANKRGWTYYRLRRIRPSLCHPAHITQFQKQELSILANRCYLGRQSEHRFVHAPNPFSSTTTKARTFSTPEVASP